MTFQSSLKDCCILIPIIRNKQSFRIQKLQHSEMLITNYMLTKYYYTLLTPMILKACYNCHI